MATTELERGLYDPGYEGSLVVLGGQYGDEGKGKFVDFLINTGGFDIVARGNGGPNAGHNIHGPDFDFPAHLMPSGIFSDALNVVGAGTVINPAKFLQEVIEVEKLFGTIDPRRLMISPRAHVILPRHIDEDGANDRVGTTRQGIGPVYADKARRTGFQLGMILSGELSENDIAQETQGSKEDVLLMLGALEELRAFIVDPADIIYSSVRAGKKVLVEGAQGVLLDTNYGTYPYVTSSGTTASGIVAGVDGLPMTAVSDVLGVFKLPMTRVGKGPFVTRLGDHEQAIHDQLVGEKGSKGAEFGATSGRERDIGWFDAVAARYAIRLAGITEIALTKLDMYDSFQQILIANSYSVNGAEVSEMPIDVRDLETAKPVYTAQSGWESPTVGQQNIDALPAGARDLIDTIEKYVGAPVRYVGTGPERRSMAIKK